MSGKGKIVRMLAVINRSMAVKLAFKLTGLDSSVLDGGPGSGNFGHKGRPGKVGGSGGGGGSSEEGSVNSESKGNTRKTQNIPGETDFGK